MTHRKIDLRNLTCPEPVLLTKKVFDDPTIKSVEALVDDEVSVRNLERLANYLRASIESTKLESESKTDSGYLVVINRDESQSIQIQKSESRPSPDNTTVIFLAKDKFGEGDEEFSRTLINLFLQTYFESGLRPQAILMANSGVKLMSKDSQSLKVLNDFKSQGTEVLACGLCVDYYGLKEDIAKEQITNMFSICEYLSSAAKVISP